MNLETFIRYCETKPNVTTDLPFGPDTLVVRVHQKIFALTGLDSPELMVNLKCDPEYAIELRQNYEEVQPGYHMNKKHWNTVSFEGKLTDRMLKSLIDHSYELAYQSLPKSIREKK
ncbi:MAG: MmcQ/YjbR family DNA-binding protein [Saprospiraceae bacterium]|nr:MmcQ/YjbR family DNA-binding protein [Candidatus Vicinibacter affinis]HQX43125.1 MmcQ/YjbR family DNA-binding protein [Saprospiraceae bacterium]MBK7305135.1 MmcQ/YjbR family DNA-binding protein [Candidatus Vicinibacter affinis]MBK8403678.1 MmcQ/YjbR family DNA-binding protein [Candidatus Vicinibacter affinis]MBK8642960.1 MmcQ/YjbR family DNA-binding protein [Candidatus Vicinibacter affinis]